MPEKPTHLDLFSGIRSADLPLQPDGQDSKRSDSARSTNTARKCSPKTSGAFWPTPSAQDYMERTHMRPSRAATGRKTGYLSEAILPNYTGTSETWMDETLEESPSSQADFLASLSALPGSAEARQMTVRSGRKCCALSRKQDPLGLLEKTLLASSVWNSTRCYLTWEPSATPQGRLLFQLAVSMPRTDGTGSGLWRTPDTEADGRGEYKDPEKIRIRWERGHQVTLSNQVRMWPTPKTPTGGGQMNRTTSGGGIRKLEDPVSKSEGFNTGSLNPVFVEWLMGFPSGFTDLKHSVMP